MTTPVDAIIFREDLYPRLETSAVTVQKYAEDLDVLPAIEINQHNELIDGWHRWTAHKKKGVAEIRTVVTQTASDGELLELAVTRNATHGLQLSREDKRVLARRIYAATPEREREATKARLATVLSVSERTVREWLSRMDKDAKEARDRRVFDLWLACWTLKEIAETVGLTKQAVDLVCQESANLPKLDKSSQAQADHAIGFEPPLYNIWRQQHKTAGSEHFGNSEIRWLDNLLYLYTKPFDIVIDPFAGGGSTIDLCKQRFRRYFVSDRVPIIERIKEIRRHDLSEGLPKPPQWKDVRLVYLDPPYWLQAAGQYSPDATDLANMPLDQFTSTLAGIVKRYAAKLSDAYIALIIQPTQYAAPDHQYTDHVADLLRAIKLPLELRVSAPMETQQYTGQMVEWAKEHRRCLVLTREIVVWRVS
jgi:hypothetical protein